jgi:hypothetical protein
MVNFIGKNCFALIFIFAMNTVVALCEDNKPFSFIFSAGMNTGGIVKKSKIDAVTSATKLGIHGGVHSEIDILSHFVETGLDYLSYRQVLSYQDSFKNNNGTRAFSMHCFSVPITYNFHLFKRDNSNPHLVLGIGISASLFLSQSIRDNAKLPNYQINRSLFSPVLKLTYFPLDLMNQYPLGAYLHISRSGNNFYTDDYFTGSQSGGLVTIGLGLSLKYRL